MALGRSTPGAGAGLGGAYRPVIRPVTSPHVSTPHVTTAVGTKPVPSWLNSAALTPAQMDAEATNEANQSIAPQVQGLQGQQQYYDAQQKAYQAAMTGFYSALAPVLAGESGQVSNAYNSAAGAMGDIAHGYAGVLGTAAASDNAEANAALTRAGQAPLAAPSSGLTDAFAATNGGILGQSFAAEGAAKASAAADVPTVWAAQGRDSLEEAITKAVAGDQQYADKIANVYASEPALRDTILKQVQAAELQKQQLRDTEATLGINQTKATAAVTNAKNSYAFKLKQLQAQEAHWNAQENNQAASITERAQAAAAARAVRLQIAQLNAANKKSGTKYKSVGDVAAAVQKEVVYLAQHGKKVPPPIGSLASPTVQVPPWQATANSIFSAYITPYVNSLPQGQRASARKQLKNVLTSAMDQAGYKRPAK